VRIRYDRYANAITASAVYNVNRHSSDDPMISAFDFVRDEESAKRKEKLREAKKYIQKVIGNMPMTTPIERLHEVRTKAISDLKASGYTNAEELFNQMWPHLKPEESEQ